MKFFSDIRLLILAIWLGAAVFFIGVAQSAFAVLPSRELAGSVVNRTLAILNYSGLAISLIMIATSLIATARISRLWLWVERFLLLVLAAACAIGQFVIGFWLSSIRLQLGRPIDDVAVEPQRHAATARSGQPRGVERHPVADIHSRAQIVALIEQ